MTNEQFIKITKADADVFNALSKAAILILIRMRFYAGANGEAYPSKATLADDTGLSIGSIKRGLKELKEADLITLRSARRTSTNIWEICGSKIDQKGIISNPKGIENDPLEDQKRSIGGSKMILEGIENDPLSRSKKEIKEIDPITSSTKNNFFADNNEIDLRDLWLGELWAKHAIAQGWSSGNVQGDFDKIKEGMSVLQVSKAVRKLDAFIVERNMAGIYMGTSWYVKIRDRWVGKETDKPATKYELEKMRHSTINVSREAIEQIETAAQDAQEAKERADAVAMSHQSKAHQIWAQFRSLDDYEACINACTDWYKSGACTADMLQEIQADPALSEFNAIIITSQY